MPTDETTITDLPQRGTVPVALSGRYLCIGPDRIDAVGLHAGRAVSYRNRRIPAEEGVAASNLVAFGNAILVFGDDALAYELDAGLDTIRRVDLAGARRSLTAHPKVDRITGELHLLTFATYPAQLHVGVSPGGLTRTMRSIDNAPNRILQLELTRDHIVFLADGFVGVTDRAGVNANATWFAVDTDERHIATAHMHGDTVIVYATGPSLVRWTLHRRAATLHCDVLDATPQAFASSNPAAHRFLWTVGTGAVHKHDLLADTRQTHDFEAGRQPGELLFITDPDRSSTEDGGWLVGFVDDETRNEADFVVLDAQAVERPAIAVVRIPRRIPGGAHGIWIPATSPI